MNAVVCQRINALAREVGLLRRRAEPGSSVAWISERLADHVEALDVMLAPSAAEIAEECFRACGDWRLAVAEALAVVDERAARVRRLLAEERHG